MNKAEKSILAMYASRLINSDCADNFSVDVGNEILQSFPSIKDIYDSYAISDKAESMSKMMAAYFHRLADSTICKQDYRTIVKDVIGDMEHLDDACYQYIDEYGDPLFNRSLMKNSESEIRELIKSNEWINLCEMIFDNDDLDMVLGKWRGNEYS